MGRKRHKGNRIGEGFLAQQYRGDNNGDLSAAWKLMKPRGWRSEETLHRAKHELLAGGFLFETRKGHRPNVCSLFAITWRTLDDATKFDAGATARFRLGDYRDAPMLKPVPAARQNASLLRLA
jgi:hypothetical protein